MSDKKVTHEVGAQFKVFIGVDICKKSFLIFSNNLSIFYIIFSWTLTCILIMFLFAWSAEFMTQRKRLICLCSLVWPLSFFTSYPLHASEWKEALQNKNNKQQTAKSKHITKPGKFKDKRYTHKTSEWHQDVSKISLKTCKIKLHCLTMRSNII